MCDRTQKWLSEIQKNMKVAHDFLQQVDVTEPEGLFSLVAQMDVIAQSVERLAALMAAPTRVIL